jgi:hypothetical protein
MFLLAVLPVLMYTSHAAEERSGRIAADNYLYAAYNAESADSSRIRQFEDWAALSLVYGELEAHMVYEAHVPAPEWSGDTTGRGVYERWVRFTKSGLSLTAGTFYALCGRGLTVKSFYNRDLRYNSNIDGVRAQYRCRFLDITAFDGRPRDFSGARLNALQGGELRVTPASWTNAGVTYAQTRLPESDKRSEWGSGYFQVQQEYATLYGEFAAKEFNTVSHGSFGDHPLGSSGTALYGTANLFVWNINGLFEAAQYDSFDLSFVQNSGSGPVLAMLNNPPPAIKEHAHTLMNRAQPVVAANNYTALHGAVTWAVTDENNISLDLSRIASREDGEGRAQGFLKCADLFGDSSDVNGIVFPVADYSDIFLKAEIVSPPGIDWVCGTGFQRTVDASHLNFAVCGDWGCFNNHSLYGGFEHQLTTINYSQRVFWSQLHTLSFARASAPRLSLALINEIMCEPVSASHDQVSAWFGAQINWTFLERNELVLFAGKRKKGKICSGGVCVNKPEFSGIELTLTSKI